MIDCLLLQGYQSPCESPPVDVKILDGRAIANMLHPVSDCKTFIQYAENVFIPFILNSQPSTVQRIDII